MATLTPNWFKQDCGKATGCSIQPEELPSSYSCADPGSAIPTHQASVQSQTLQGLHHNKLLIPRESCACTEKLRRASPHSPPTRRQSITGAHCMAGRSRGRSGHHSGPSKPSGSQLFGSGLGGGAPEPPPLAPSSFAAPLTCQTCAVQPSRRPASCTACRAHEVPKPPAATSVTPHPPPWRSPHPSRAAVERTSRSRLLKSLAVRWNRSWASALEKKVQASLRSWRVARSGKVQPLGTRRAAAASSSAGS